MAFGFYKCAFSLFLLEEKSKSLSIKKTKSKKYWMNKDQLRRSEIFIEIAFIIEEKLRRSEIFFS